MATQQSRARYPARITFQMSSELKAQLLEVAERDHEGDVQALGRQCLQDRVERRGAGTDRLAEILDALERLPTEIAGRHLEQWERVNQLLEQGGRMFTVMDDALTEIAGRHLEQWERVNQLLEQGGRMFTVMDDALTEIAGRHLEQWERVNQLLEQGGRMFTVLNDDLTEMMAIRDELSKLVGRPAEQ